MKLTVERTDQQWTSKQAVNSPKETYCTAMYCTAHCVRSSLGHKQTNKQTEKERKRENKVECCTGQVQFSLSEGAAGSGSGSGWRSMVVVL